MKYYHLLSLFVFVFSSNAYSYQPKVEIIEQFDDLTMVAFLDVEDIKNNPEWIPGNNVLPLNVTDAIRAVAALNKDAVANKIVEIEIRQIPRHKNKWHYLIKVSNEEMKSKYNIYVVLMSGKVVTAIIEPQSYK